MNTAHEIENLVSRLVTILERSSYRRTLRQSFGQIVEILSRPSQDVIPAVAHALATLSPPASSALRDLLGLALDCTPDLWLPRAAASTDAVTVLLPVAIIKIGEPEPLKTVHRFDATPVARLLRHAFRIPRTIQLALEGTFLDPEIFTIANVPKLVAHRRYVAGTIPRIPFTGAIQPWDGWNGLALSGHKSYYPEKGDAVQDQLVASAVYRCIVATLLGPLDVIEDVTLQPCADRPLEELYAKLLEVVHLPRERLLFMHDELALPSELHVAIEEFSDSIDHVIRTAIKSQPGNDPPGAG